MSQYFTNVPLKPSEYATPANSRYKGKKKQAPQPAIFSHQPLLLNFEPVLRCFRVPASPLTSKTGQPPAAEHRGASNQQAGCRGDQAKAATTVTPGADSYMSGGRFQGSGLVEQEQGVELRLALFTHRNHLHAVFTDGAQSESKHARLHCRK